MCPAISGGNHSSTKVCSSEQGCVPASGVVFNLSCSLATDQSVQLLGEGGCWLHQYTAHPVSWRAPAIPALRKLRGHQVRTAGWCWQQTCVALFQWGESSRGPCQSIISSWLQIHVCFLVCVSKIHQQSSFGNRVPLGAVHTYLWGLTGLQSPGRRGQVASKMQVVNSYLRLLNHCGEKRQTYVSSGCAVRR